MSSASISYLGKSEPSAGQEALQTCHLSQRQGEPSWRREASAASDWPSRLGALSHFPTSWDCKGLPA